MVVMNAVEYAKSQDPYLLRTWQYNCTGPTMIALSADARTVALASLSTVSVYSVMSEDCVATFQDVFTSTLVSICCLDLTYKFLAVVIQCHLCVMLHDSQKAGLASIQ